MDTKKDSLLDPLWYKACSKSVPENFIFESNDTDLLDRYRLHLYYTAFKSGDPEACDPLNKIQIRTSGGIIESDEFKNYIVCSAAATRQPNLINAEYYRMESVVSNKNCELYPENTLRNACKLHLSRIQ